MLPIYTITTIPYDFPSRDSRCVGWLEHCTEAVDILKYNRGDIYEEGHYRFAIVEQVESGIYMLPLQELWFEWSEDRVLKGVTCAGYKRIEKPNRFHSVCCFSMG